MSLDKGVLQWVDEVQPVSQWLDVTQRLTKFDAPCNRKGACRVQDEAVLKLAWYETSGGKHACVDVSNKSLLYFTNFKHKWYTTCLHFAYCILTTTSTGLFLASTSTPSRRPTAAFPVCLSLQRLGVSQNIIWSNETELDETPEIDETPWGRTPALKQPHYPWQIIPDFESLVMHTISSERTKNTGLSTLNATFCRFEMHHSSFDLWVYSAKVEACELKGCTCMLSCRLLSMRNGSF